MSARSNHLFAVLVINGAYFVDRQSARQARGDDGAGAGACDEVEIVGEHRVLTQLGVDDVFDGRKISSVGTPRMPPP